MNRRGLLFSGAALMAMPLKAFAHTAFARSVLLSHPDGRSTRVRIIAPTPQANPLPVVLFSHGANSTADLYDAMLKPVADAGSVVMAVDHLDAGGPADPDRIPAQGLFNSRVADLSLPLQHTAAIENACAELGVRPDWQRVCAMGHSFGAVVAMSLAGATVVQSVNQPATATPHPAVSAVITVSPPAPREGLVPLNAWETVQLPALTVTGTQDILPGFIDDWRQHIAGYETGSGGDRWQVIGQGVDHYFGGLICRLSEGHKAEAQRPALFETNAVLIDFLRQWSEGKRPRPTSARYRHLSLDMV